MKNTAKTQITVSSDNMKIMMRGAKNHTLVKETNKANGKTTTNRWYKACAKSVELPHRKGNAHTKGAKWDAMLVSTDKNGKSVNEYRLGFDTRDEAREFVSSFNAMVASASAK